MGDYAEDMIDGYYEVIDNVGERLYRENYKVRTAAEVFAHSETPRIDPHRHRVGEHKMSDEADGRVVFTQPARMVFAALDKPKRFKKNGKESGEAKYSATFLLHEDDVKGLKERAADVARGKWPGRKLSELKFPFTEGDKEADKAASKEKDGEFFRGCWVLRASSKFPPLLSKLENGKVVNYEGEDRIAILKPSLYSGCYAYAQVNFVAYDAVGENGRDGVTAYLDMVLRAKDGDRIGGADPATAFRGVVGQHTDENPLGNEEDNDEIPF